jgi:hypothetical protein
VSRSGSIAPWRRFICSFGCALCQLSDFVSDDGKAAALFAGSGGLNGGIQREQIRLIGDVVNYGNDLSDLL